jgi:hypothetical protein
MPWSAAAAQGKQVTIDDDLITWLAKDLVG